MEEHATDPKTSRPSTVMLALFLAIAVIVAAVLIWQLRGATNGEETAIATANVNVQQDQLVAEEGIDVEQPDNVEADDEEMVVEVSEPVMQDEVIVYTSEEYGIQLSYLPTSRHFSHCDAIEGCALKRKLITEYIEDDLNPQPFQQFTYESALEDREYIRRGVGDDIVRTQSGIVARRQIRMEEGGGIVHKFYWYDDNYQYSLQTIFPYDEEIEKEFKAVYIGPDERERFVVLVNTGNEPYFQDFFTAFDDIFSTVAFTE